MKYFTKHVLDPQTAPGDTYLLLDWTTHKDAYVLSDDCTLDLDALVKAALPDCVVEVANTTIGCGTCYASIITDGREPDSVVVWDASDVFITPDYY